MSPEGGGRRAGADRGRGRFSGEGGRERGANGLWKERIGEVSQLEPPQCTSLSFKSAQKDISLQCSVALE